MAEIFSKENCLNHYKWGDNCDGWNFIGGLDVTVKQELMPGQTAEKLHFHSHAKQFFFVLKGEATFLINDEIFLVCANKGMQIEAGDRHKIMNVNSYDLEFLLFSYPSTQNDRTDCE